MARVAVQVEVQHLGTDMGAKFSHTGWVFLSTTMARLHQVNRGKNQSKITVAWRGYTKSIAAKTRVKSR